MVCAAPARDRDAPDGRNPPRGSSGSREDRRHRRQARLKADIFQVALGLLTEKGYDEVTVDEIATAADIAKGTFFNYFPSKEHLLVEYRRSLLDFIHDYGDTLQGDSTRELMKRYFRKLSRRVRAEGDRYEMLFKEIVARPHLVALDHVHHGRYHPYFERWIEMGKQSGELPEGCDARLLAETIRDIWTGTSYSWVIENPTASLEGLMLRKIDWLFDMLGDRASLQE